MADEPTRVVLPDGTEVWARVAGAASLGDAGGRYRETGFGDRVAARVQGLNDLVRGVAGSLREATAQARPDQVTVEFGIELAARPGGVVGLLADGEAKAAIQVSLSWDRRSPAGGGPDPATDDGEPDAGGSPASDPADPGPPDSAGAAPGGVRGAP